MRKDLMNNNQHHYLNELNFPTNRDLKTCSAAFIICWTCRKAGTFQAGTISSQSWKLKKTKKA